MAAIAEFHWVKIRKNGDYKPKQKQHKATVDKAPNKQESETSRERQGIMQGLMGNVVQA